MTDTGNARFEATSAAASAITREDHVIEIPQVTYRDNAFPDGELSALLDGDDVNVRISTIDGDMTVRVPLRHLGAVTDLLNHIRDDL